MAPRQLRHLAVPRADSPSSGCANLVLAIAQEHLALCLLDSLFASRFETGQASSGRRDMPPRAISGFPPSGQGHHLMIGLEGFPRRFASSWVLEDHHLWMLWRL